MVITGENKLKKYKAECRLWQGIPTVAVTRGVRVFLSFYSGGTKEYYGNYCVLEKSDDGGRTFSDAVAAVDVGSDARAFDPCLWIDPHGRLWWICNVMPEYAAYAYVCDDPDAEELVFGEPIKIADGIIINKPTVLGTGEWIFCASVWKAGDFQSIPPRGDRPVENAVKTSDCGKSFRVVGGVEVPDKHFGESMLTERSDGTLDIYTRTRYGIAKSSSFDGGVSWTKTADSGIAGPDSRFCIRRLRSGRLLLVNHKNFSGRNNLYAMLSDDDGQTWSDGIALDLRDNVSYPDCAENDDGFIYIVYDRERGAYCKSLEECLKKPREILVAKLAERDILAGRLVSKGSALQTVADKLGEYRGEDENPFGDYGTGNVREYVLALAEIDDGNEIVSRIFRDYGNCCFTITDEQRKIIDDNCAVLTTDDGGDICRKITAIQSITEVLLFHAKSNEIDALNSAFVDRVRTYVGRNISDSQLRLDKMADELCISKFYMCHVFKNMTGTTVSQYINFRRLAVAKKLLTETDNSIVSVALAVGFLDGGYFSKWFKKSEGVTPLRYRELNA